MKSKLSLPDYNWKKATCVVCGNTFDYLKAKRPPTCKNGECIHTYHYKIDPQTWAGYQPTLFDVPNEPISNKK